MADASEPLRVGLLVDTLQLPAWVRHIIADIQASQYARIALVIEGWPAAGTGLLARRIWRRRSRLAYLACIDGSMSARFARLTTRSPEKTPPAC